MYSQTGQRFTTTMTYHSRQLCPHCGHVMGGHENSRGTKVHLKKCKNAHPAEVKYFKEMGYWPRPQKNGKLCRRVLEEMAKDGR